MSFTILFSHSIGCLFILLKVSFAVQKLSSLVQYYKFVFAFVSSAQGDIQNKFAIEAITVTSKKLRCPSADEQIRKFWFIYTMEYYPAIKRNAFESVLMRCMNLELIIQTEVSQKENERYCILTHIYGFQKDGTADLCAGQQRRHRHKEQTFGLSESRGWDDLRGQH